MRRAALSLLALALILPAGAGAKTIHFRGEQVRVPSGWPVIRLAARPSTCVRLDRRAVYLGRPGTAQRCPAGAIGRRRAILVDPGARRRAARQRARASRLPLASLSDASEYTGPGFDACTAPSRRSMSAWSSSPYRAIGVYIGGVNRGCSQPNLTASWVAAQIAAGWRLIPTYVGLQAPTTSCGSCAELSPGSASLQGAAAADDAVNRARIAGIGAGSPIYLDMESYTRTAASSSATLTFLAAWTNRLHALGYESGVYSSSASGIADLVSRLGALYRQPDDIWIANWNGRKGTADPYVPASAWSEHQRIHQYRGGHNETWGGVTINIDNDYVEGATVGAAGASPDDPKGYLDSAAAPLPGQVRVRGWAFDPSAPDRSVAIRAYVGGDRGARGVLRYELGPVAVQPRLDVALTYRRAGEKRGFDATFAVAKSGRERVCVYAVDIGPGADRRLGCRSVAVPVPISLTAIGARRNAVRVRVRCEWPAGTQCPGQLLLRARVRVRVAGASRRRRRPTRTVKARIARRPFRLTGGRSHAFRIGLDRRGRRLTRGRRKLRAELVVAIPDGRVTRTVVLAPPGR